MASVITVSTRLKPASCRLRVSRSGPMDRPVTTHDIGRTPTADQRQVLSIVCGGKQLAFPPSSSSMQYWTHFLGWAPLELLVPPGYAFCIPSVQLLTGTPPS